MSVLDYPKLKHILSEKWAEISCLQCQFTEDFVTAMADRRMVLRAQGTLGYRKKDSAYSFRRESHSRTEIQEAAGTNVMPAEILTLFDSQHVYEEQHVTGRKFVYIYTPHHRSVRMTIPCIHFFKFLERRGIIQDCSEQTVENAPFYLIGLEVLQAEQSKGAQPALEVFYLHHDTGLLACERLFDSARHEIGRRVYLNHQVNHEPFDSHYAYVKAQDVIALPLEE
ncbi:MAG: hypothetical protein HYV26_10020 [Candidatus Hydrogenedentes bacterium]|nr:hypothetical protein [Candidatus Hydrogenedentota bacterium]